jgi:hypothetical protein
MVSKVFDIKDVCSGFALVLPLFSVSVKYSMAKKIIHGIVERWTFLVVFKIGFTQVVSRIVPNLYNVKK